MPPPSTTSHHLPPQLLSEALLAASAGLDVNDEPKALAAIGLLTAALASTPALRGAGEGEADEAAAAAEEAEELGWGRAAAAAGGGPAAMQVGYVLHSLVWLNHVGQTANVANLSSRAPQRLTRLTSH